MQKFVEWLGSFILTCAGWYLFQRYIDWVIDRMPNKLVEAKENTNGDDVLKMVLGIVTVLIFISVGLWLWFHK
jgi:hypothetical protein